MPNQTQDKDGIVYLADLKFPNKCKICGQKIEAHGEAWWFTLDAPKKSYAHISCYVKPTKQAQTTTQAQPFKRPLPDVSKDTKQVKLFSVPKEELKSYSDELWGIAASVIAKNSPQIDAESKEYYELIATIMQITHGKNQSVSINEQKQIMTDKINGKK